MNTSTRIRRIRLIEKIEVNAEFSHKLGLKITSEFEKRFKQAKEEKSNDQN